MNNSTRSAGSRGRRAEHHPRDRQAGPTSAGRALGALALVGLSAAFALGLVGWVLLSDRLLAPDSPPASAAGHQAHAAAEHEGHAAGLRRVLGPLTAASADAAVSLEAQVAVDERDARGPWRVGDGIPVGQKVVLSFRLADPRTAAPLAGLAPAAELRSDTARPVNPYALPEPDDPFDTHETFVLVGEAGDLGIIESGDQGGHAHRPGVSLTRVTGSTFAAVVKLPGPSPEVVADRTGQYLFASIPDTDQVAIVDTLTRRVLHSVKVGKRPYHLAAEPAGRRIWVANDGDSTVTAIDAETHTPRSIAVGAGHHAFAFSTDGRLVFVSNADSGTVSVVGAEDGRALAEVPVGRAPHGLAVAADRLYVANAGSGTISVLAIDGDRLLPVATIPAGAGTTQVRVHPGGQVGVASNREANTLTVFETATDQVLKTVPAGRGPDEIVFLEDYAVVRNASSPDVTFVNLTNPDVADEIPIGAEPVLDAPRPGAHAGLFLNGAGDEVLVPSPVEGVVHHLHVMMGRPMAMSQTRVDRGSQVVLAPAGVVREVAPGTYQRVVRFDQAGSYSLAIQPGADRPGVSFTFDVVAPKVVKPWLVTPIAPSAPYRAGQEGLVQFRVARSTGDAEEAVRDAVITVYRVEPGQGIWQRVVPAEPAGAGIYQVRVTFPAPGPFHATFTSLGLGLTAEDGQAADLEVVEP